MRIDSEIIRSPLEQINNQPQKTKFYFGCGKKAIHFRQAKINPQFTNLVPRVTSLLYFYAVREIVAVHLAL